MNFFAHGRSYIDRPYFLAGTAIPDWLNVVNRRARARPKGAAPLVDHEDPRTSQLAAGVLRHHHDDHWFHATRAFAELSLEFARIIRADFHRDDSLLPMFLGHILVELLLDAELIADQPGMLESYYRSVQQVDVAHVTQVVQQMTGKNVDLLPVVISRFAQEQFMADYLHDKPLYYRLNRIMHRVGLPEIPTSFVEWLPAARRMVAARCDELLTEPTATHSATLLSVA